MSRDPHNITLSKLKLLLGQDSKSPIEGTGISFFVWIFNSNWWHQKYVRTFFIPEERNLFPAIIFKIWIFLLLLTLWVQHWWSSYFRMHFQRALFTSHFIIRDRLIGFYFANISDNDDKVVVVVHSGAKQFQLAWAFFSVKRLRSSTFTDICAELVLLICIFFALLIFQRNSLRLLNDLSHIAWWCQSLIQNYSNFEAASETQCFDKKTSYRLQL